MITVTVQHYKEFPETISSPAIEMLVNSSADALADSIRSNVQGLKCKNHPTANQTIKIIAGKNPPMRVEKNFCCTEFRDSIQINLK